MFKWRTGRAEAPADQPDSRPCADLIAGSTVLPKFLAAVAHQSAPVLLDLGPAVGANVEFFGERLACRIRIENLFEEVDRAIQAGGGEGLAAALAERLTSLAPGSVDGILCWDLFDYLDRPTGQALASQLAQLLRKGGALHGFFGTTPIELAYRTRFAIQAEDRLVLRQTPAAPVSRTVLLTRDIALMFRGLAVSESVLLKSSTRETLFRRA